MSSPDAGYVWKDALISGRYDFNMGSKVAPALESLGVLQLVYDMRLPDLELAFQGQARPDVFEAWLNRFHRMKLLQSFAADGFQALRDDFLACLSSPAHRSASRVVCCVLT